MKKAFKGLIPALTSASIVLSAFFGVLVTDINGSALENGGTRTEVSGSYTNDFNASNLAAALGNDFSFAYDAQDTLFDQLVPKTFEEASEYLKLENGAVTRVEKEAWMGENMRPYWQQIYAYYKTQSFDEFTFSVDLKTNGSAFNIIHFTPALNKSIYEGGFSFAVKNNDGNTHAMFLGTSDEAIQVLGGAWVGNNGTSAYTEVDGLGSDFYNVKINFKGGTALVYINGIKVLEKVGLPQDSYYAAVSLGFANGSAFDNFSYSSLDSSDTFKPVEESGKYENSFNANSLKAAFNDDFCFVYDAQDSVGEKLIAKSFDEAKEYLKLQNGAVTRIEKENWMGENMRPYWQQMYAYYQNQSFESFTFNVDLKTHGSGFNMIHFSPVLNGSIYDSGFSFVVKNNDGNTHAMFLGNSEEATQALGGAWVGNNSTAAYAEVEGLALNYYNVKIDFSDGTAVVYINGAKVLEKTGLPKESYYAAVSLGFGSGNSFDNFSYISKQEVAFKPIEADGRYINSFDAKNLEAAFNDDFSFGYAADNWSGSGLTSKNFNEAKDYFKLENGAVCRVEKENWMGDNFRPYWQQMYAYYKNQCFGNFTFSVDLKTHGGAFNIIHFSPTPNETIYDGGFSFVVRNNGNELEMFLGDSAEARKDLDFFYVKEESTASHGKYTVYPSDVHNIKIIFSKGSAEVYIDDAKVLEKTGLPKASYYAAVAMGFGGGSSFDNFSYISSDDVTFERTEEAGKYTNNFNSSNFYTALGNDFTFGYDAVNDREGALIPKTDEEAMEYLSVIGGAVCRVDKENWEGDNMRPYWQQMYAVYKNQTFDNFTLSVDLRTGGSAYNIIHFGSTTKGNIYADGFSLVMKNNDGNMHAMFLGDDKEAFLGLKGPWIMEAESTASYAEVEDLGTDFHNYKIVFSHGTAIVYVDGKEVLEKSGLAQDDYYASISLGYNSLDSFDNLSIVSHSYVEPDIDPSDQSKVTGVEKVEDISFKMPDVGSKEKPPLPKLLKVTTDKNEVIECRIAWDSDDYNENVIGKYNFIGYIILPLGGRVINPDGITAKTVLNLLEDDPLIGEEPDDGSLIKISGLPYTVRNLSDNDGGYPAKTGDDTQAALWATLLSVSVGVILAYLQYSHYKKQSK